jgi:hypothetical protein
LVTIFGYIAVCWLYRSLFRHLADLLGGLHRVVSGGASLQSSLHSARSSMGVKIAGPIVLALRSISIGTTAGTSLYATDLQ